MIPHRAGRRRISLAQFAVINLLKRHPTGRLSFDDMEAATGYDRRQLITVIRVLEHNQAVEVESPRGTQPNRYRLKV